MEILQPTQHLSVSVFVSACTYTHLNPPPLKKWGTLRGLCLAELSSSLLLPYFQKETGVIEKEMFLTTQLLFDTSTKEIFFL